MNLRDRLTSAVDWTVGVFSPHKALERKAARKVSEQFSDAYRGSESTRIHNTWQVTSGSPDADILPVLDVLRERSRDLIRNDPHAASIVNSMVDNIVGTGIRPQAQIDATRLGISEEQAAEIQKACERAWDRWTPYADAARKFNFYDFQSQVIRSLIVNGESLCLPLRLERNFSPFNFCLELVEPDRIEAPGQMDQVNGRFNRRSGIELGRGGYPHAVYVKVSHPGDGIYTRNSDERYRKILFTDSDGRLQVYHLLNQTRPGQTRGEPMLSPCLNLFQEISQMTEAVVTAQRVAACHTLFITQDDPYNSALNRSDEIARAQRLESIEPGMVTYLSPGQSVEFGTPSGNHGTTYDAFVTRHLRSIGAALGLPYEVIAKDYSNTSYSSSRAADLIARRVWTKWQQYLIEHFCKPVWEQVIEEAWLRGEIPFTDFEANRFELTRSRWVPPAHGWIDPLKEVQASQISIETGLSSIAVEAAAQGRDWEAIAEQRAREQAYQQELMRKYGAEDVQAE